MGIQPPFLYDAVGRESINSSVKVEYNPRRVAPRPPRSKHEGPLIASARNSYNSFASTSSPTRSSWASTASPTRKSFVSIPKSAIETFDKHPLDSPSTLPQRNTDANSMSPLTKMLVIRTRFVQLLLRCLELLGALGLLVMTILISNIPSKTGLIIRIPPGVALLHTAYGIYHLARRASGRPPASTASYMLFAACFDLTLLPFYTFTAILSESQHKDSLEEAKWSTLLGKSLLPKFSETVFLLATVTGGLHLISLMASIWLGVIFKKITNLPPDMNPLEANLTSRHHKKSKITSSVSAYDLRLSEPSLESKGDFGAAVYEDLLRPPLSPFRHSRTSVESFSTYHQTPPPSRGSSPESPISRDLLSRGQHQILTPCTSPGCQYQHASSYTDIPLSDENPIQEPFGRQHQLLTPCTSPECQYQHGSSYTEIPLSDINPQNQFLAPCTSPECQYEHGSCYTGIPLNDINPIPVAPEKASMTVSPTEKGIKSKDSWFACDSLVQSKKPTYEPIARPSFDDFEFEFPHGSPHASTSPTTHNQSQPNPLSERNPNRNDTPKQGELSLIREESVHSASSNSSIKSPQKTASDKDSLKGKYYGDLRPGTPPIMVGPQRQIVMVGGKRQVSTGADIEFSDQMGWRVRSREVSGRVVEEGRGWGFGERIRRVSSRRA